MTDPNILFTAPIVNGSGAANNQNCSVELLGLAIYGNYRHGYRLPCLDGAAQQVVVGVNDRLSAEAKQTRRWRLLIARLAQCHKHDSDRLNLRMALWAARSVEHLADDPAVKACNDVLERWISGEATDKELVEARTTTYAATATYATYAASTAASAATAYSAAYAATAYSATAASAATATAYSATYATYAATAATDRDDALMEWLDQYLTAWHKTAVDEGEAIPDEQEAEYAEFVNKLFALTESDAK